MDYVSQNNPELSRGHSLSHQIPFGHPSSYVILSDVPHASYSDVSSSSKKKKLSQLPSVMFILLMCFAVIREMTAAWDSWKRKWRIYSAEYKSYCVLFQGASRYQSLVWGGGLHGIGYMVVIHTHPCCAFIIHCLLSSPFSPHKIEDRGCCLLFPGWWKNTLHAPLPITLCRHC